MPGFIRFTPPVKGPPPMVPCYCTAPATTGYFCNRHAQGLIAVIRNTPELLAELDITAARLDVQAKAPGSGSAWDNPLPLNMGAVDAADRLRNALMACALAGLDARARRKMPQDALEAACKARTGFNRLAARPDAHSLALGLLEAYRAGQRATDRAQERIRYGVCHCGAELIAPADRETVHCRACSADYAAAELRAFRYVAATEALAEQTGTLGELQKLLAATGHNVSVRRMEGWARRKKAPLVSVGKRGRFTIYRYADAARIAKSVN